MPDAFIGMAFKKHVSEIVNERARDHFYQIFFYLPSTTDRLSTINCKYESFNAFYHEIKISFLII